MELAEKPSPSVSATTINHRQPAITSCPIIVHLADYLSGQTDKEKEGKPPSKVLDPATRSIISLDPDALDTIVKKAHHYTKSLTGRLAKR